MTTHFIGIGGIGMSGLAKILVEQGERVTGSDAKESARTRQLADIGAIIRMGHSRDHVQKTDTVVYSSGVADDNPELVKYPTARRYKVELPRQGSKKSSTMLSRSERYSV